MKKKMGVILFVLAMVLPFCIPRATSADIGPKASVHIIFENMGDELCYGTLLSEHEYVGPYQVWDGREESGQHQGNNEYADLDYETWKKFVEYEDADDYVFLQEAWNLLEEPNIDWTYYPPDKFKILLYFPERDIFVVSEPCERYAFATYYAVDMDGINFESVKYDEDLSNNDAIEAYKAYNYRIEMRALLCRMIATILIELIIALLFRIIGVKELLLVAGANIATQIILNVLLNLFNYNRADDYLITYLFFEFLVFGIEAVIYCFVLKKISKKPLKNYIYVIYAAVANVVSCGIGFAIYYFIMLMR